MLALGFSSPSVLPMNFISVSLDQGLLSVPTWHTVGKLGFLECSVLL